MSQPLDQLLVNLAAAEKAADFDAAALLVKEVKEKVDEIKEYTDRLYAEGERLSKYRGEFQKSAAACKNEADGIYDRVFWCMSQTGFTDLPGTRWRIHLQKGEQLVKFVRQPDADIYKSYPLLVKREVTYSWDEERVRLLLEAGNEFEYAHLVDKQFAKFYVKKEV